MKLRGLLKLQLLILFIGSVLLFQNCGSKVNFGTLTGSPSSMTGEKALTTGTPSAPAVDTETDTGDVVAQVDNPIEVSPPGSKPGAESGGGSQGSDGGSSNSGNNGQDGNQNGGHDSSGDSKVGLCWVAKTNGAGKSDRAGYDTVVKSFLIIHGVAKDACVTKNACENIIATKFPGQKMMWDESAVCEHNKNVDIMSDDDVRKACSHSIP